MIVPRFRIGRWLLAVARMPATLEALARSLPSEHDANVIAARTAERDAALAQLREVNESRNRLLRLLQRNGIAVPANEGGG